jgi:hypothetical protein
MRSYMPDPEDLPEGKTEQDLRVIRSIQRRNRMIEWMHLFNSSISAKDFAGLVGNGEKVQYTCMHKSMKVKGGRPPMDYTAIEMLVDFRHALRSGFYEDAIPLYYSLRKLLHMDR